MQPLMEMVTIPAEQDCPWKTYTTETMKYRSIADRVQAFSCEPAELVAFLASRYGSLGGDLADSRAIIFPGNPSSYLVKLCFNKRNRLVDMRVTDTFGDDKIDDLHSRIAADLLEKSAPRVGNRILFSHLPVLGSFKYRDMFQVLPVPEEAPKADGLGSHPFQVQFQYFGSQNGSVETQRSGRVARRIELLLAALISPQIHSQRFRRDWFATATDGNPVPVDGYTFYDFPGFTGTKSAFSNTGALRPMLEIEATEFYQSISIEGPRELSIPSSLALSFDRYFNLDDTMRGKFDRSAHWLQHSISSYRHSKSASYVSLAIAIECLLDDEKVNQNCDACMRPIGPGLTKRFKTFLEAFVHQGPNRNVQLKRFYEIRSKIAHGSALLLLDENPDDLGPLAFDDSQRLYALHSLARGSLVNWLHSR